MNIESKADQNQKSGAGASAFWLVFIAAALWRVAVAVKLDLSFDEGYYFSWALEPQLSYFDHPPLTAWAIYLGHAFFGDTVWCVRIWPLLAGTGLVLAGRALANELFGARVANHAGILLALIPIFVGNGIFMTPDTLFVFCWAVALLFVWKAIASEQVLSPWWLLAGLFVGFGFLSKYNMVLFFPTMGLLWLTSPGYRLRIFVGTAICGVLALMVFSPVIVWNAQHEWRSFLFQLHHGFGGKPSSVFRHVSEYLGALLLIATPLLAALILWNSARSIFAADFKRKFCAVFSILIAAFFFVSALKAHVEANWPMLAFFTGAILIANDWDRYPRRLQRSTVIVMAICCAGLGFYALLPAQFPFALGKRSFDSKRMEEFIGGPELAARVEEARVRSGADIVYAADHQIYGRLLFYAPAMRPVLCPGRGGRYRFPWVDCAKWTGKKALIVSRSELNLPSQFDFKTTKPDSEILIPYKKLLKEKFRLYIGEGYTPDRIIAAPDDLS